MHYGKAIWNTDQDDYPVLVHDTSDLLVSRKEQWQQRIPRTESSSVTIQHQVVQYPTNNDMIVTRT